MKVAALQLAPTLANAEENVATACELLQRLQAEGVDLAVFPEAYLTGYCFSSKQEATDAALELRGQELQIIADCCQNIAAIVGFAERTPEDIFNSAAVIDKGEIVGVYRKTHLPYLGLDRFATPGDDLPLFEIKGAKVGIAICYDVRIPEVSRSYALSGADILCIPTNWPQPAKKSSDLVCPTRAIENHVYVIAADRVGDERGFHFVGRSKIIDPLGNIIASADHDQEAIVIAEIDPTSARDKNIIKKPGEYELPLFESRNPALYSRLQQK